MGILFLLARFIFGGYFFYGGWGHLENPTMLAGYAKSKGVPLPRFSVISSGIIALLGGAGIVLGVFPKISALLIIVFLIPVTFKMHPYWKSSDQMQRMNDRIAFMKNVALIGGALAFMFIPTPWFLSLL